MPHRFAFVTIGQTPRTDLVPEIVSRLPTEAVVDEMGILDEFGPPNGTVPDGIVALAPEPGEARLVTRLTDGTQVVLGKAGMQRRLQNLLNRLDPEPYTAVVLLCTGEFPGLKGPGLFLDAQHLVDHGAAGLSAGAKRLGLLLPLAEQTEESHWRPGPDQELLVSHASPYEGHRFVAAARELSEADLIVMHCMGYTEVHREEVARVSGRPVLLARRLVATALANLL